LDDAAVASGGASEMVTESAASAPVSTGEGGMEVGIINTQKYPTVDMELLVPPMEADFDIDWEIGEYDEEQIRIGKTKEINNMAEFGLYEPCPEAEIDPSGKWISARWENQQRGDEVRCRYVAREYKKLDPFRDDVFTPSSTPTTSRLIDFKATKLSQPTFIADAVNAYFNAIEPELVYTQPPREWLAVQGLKGERTDVVWRLKKKLYGERDASVGFNDFVFDVLVTKMGFTRCAVQPCFYRHEKDDVDVEVHQDDFYATAPGAMLSRFAEEIIVHMKLKISPLLYIGMRYSNLKCGRSRLQDGMYISGM